jgi:hypothetical protein
LCIVPIRVLRIEKEKEWAEIGCALQSEPIVTATTITATRITTQTIAEQINTNSNKPLGTYLESVEEHLPSHKSQYLLHKT